MAVFSESADWDVQRAVWGGLMKTAEDEPRRVHLE